MENFKKKVEARKNAYTGEIEKMLNKSAIMERAIKDVLEVVDGNGVPNIEWVKNRLLEAVT